MYFASDFHHGFIGQVYFNAFWFSLQAFHLLLCVFMSLNVFHIHCKLHVFCVQRPFFPYIMYFCICCRLVPTVPLLCPRHVVWVWNLLRSLLIDTQLDGFQHGRTSETQRGWEHENKQRICCLASRKPLHEDSWKGLGLAEVVIRIPPPPMSSIEHRLLLSYQRRET